MSGAVSAGFVCLFVCCVVLGCSIVLVTMVIDHHCFLQLCFSWFISLLLSTRHSVHVAAGGNLLAI